MSWDCLSLVHIALFEHDDLMSSFSLTFDFRKYLPAAADMHAESDVPGMSS